MSRKQQPRPVVNNNYTASRAAAAAPSPYEERLGRMSNDVLDWAAKGDYRERPKGVFFNFADPAERRRRRELSSNSLGQGTAAMGAAASPTLVALNKDHIAAEQERDDAGAYEQDVSRGVGQAAAVSGDLARMDNARRLGVMSSDASIYNAELGRIAQENSQPPWWQRLLGGI